MQTANLMKHQTSIAILHVCCARILVRRQVKWSDINVKKLKY